MYDGGKEINIWKGYRNGRKGVKDEDTKIVVPLGISTSLPLVNQYYLLGTR
jgi:hypothetical protein